MSKIQGFESAGQLHILCKRNVAFDVPFFVLFESAGQLHVAAHSRRCRLRYVHFRATHEKFTRCAASPLKLKPAAAGLSVCYLGILMGLSDKLS